MNKDSELPGGDLISIAPGDGPLPPVLCMVWAVAYAFVLI
jgi:hypothetical protein